MKTRKNISREKARKSFFNSESAGATVVAAILLLSIIFTVLAVVRIEYVPMWKSDAEQSHMNEVQKDMAELKSTADMVSLFTSSEPNTSVHGFPVTVSVSMGGGQIPVMEPSKSSGTLSLNTERCRMVITPQRDSISTPAEIVDCGGVTYYSNNREYLDQVLRYENGALILSQKDRSLMRQSPSFKIERTRDNYTVSIHAIKMTGNPDSISSNTDASLRLTGLDTESVYDSNGSGGIDSFTCSILTEYPDAWVSYINETAENANLEYDTDYIVDKIGSNTVYFSCLDNGTKNLERLYVSKSVIQAELGDGMGLDNENVSNSKPEENKSIMKLGEWYTFELSDNGTAILPLKDNKTEFVFPASYGKDVRLKDYDDATYEPNNAIYILNTPFKETFRFNSFTKFESNVSKVTVRMIYRSETDPTYISSVGISGNFLDNLEPYDYKQNNWYLFNETKDVSVNYPSELNLSMNINQAWWNKKIYIDYLAVRLD